MLSNLECSAFDMLFEDLVNSTVALRPMANTPLAELVKSTTTMPLTDLTQKDATLTHTALKEESDNALHNGWTNEVVERASEILNRRIDVIKSTVIPTIKGISESVLADVVPLGDSDFNFNIVRYSVCDAVNIDLFMNDVKRNAPSFYLSPELYFKEANLSTPQILERLKTGNNALDDAIAVAVHRVGEDNVFRMWESLFVDRTKMAITNYDSFDGFVFNQQFGLDYAIVIYQLATNLQSSDKKASVQYKEAAAHVISVQAKVYNNAINSGALIKSRKNSVGAIEVYTLNYTGFLQKGGTAEMVIGAANNQSFYYSTADILNNAKEIEKDYRVLKAASSVEYRQKVRQATVSSLRNHFMRSLKYEQTAYETAYFEKHPGDMSLVVEKFECLLELISAGSIKDVYRRVCEVVCNSRFFYVDCYAFLKTIDTLCEEGNEPQDAFAQAVIGEISDFVVSQIKA